MSKVLDTQIKKYEKEKEKLLGKQTEISEQIKSIDLALKPLYKLREEEEGMMQKQKELENRILQQINASSEGE